MTVSSLEVPLIEIWRRSIESPNKVWAIFEHGTCVVFADSHAEAVEKAAVTLLREWGPVHPGSPAGDFSVIELDRQPGWVVTCHHPDILTYVDAREFDGAPSELEIGLLGRSRRAQDAAQLNVLYVHGQSAGAPICFYSKSVDHHELSNFSPFGFEEGGVRWPTVEHYFQAQKFAEPEHAAYRERIRRVSSPKQAKSLGRTRAIPIRADWDSARDQVMLAALRMKFADPTMRTILLETGLRQLVEASPTDSYWGRGRSGNGTNRLGQLMMQVRAELRCRLRA